MNKEYFEDDLKTMNFLGEVVENNDTEKLGRIKVKVFGKFDTLAVEDIPWAYPSNNYSAGSSTGGSFYSVPKMNSTVNITFDNGNIYHPIYTYHQKPSEELKTEIGDDVENFHSLLYDTVIENGLKIYYSQNAEKGFFINLKNTLINIKNDNSFNIKNPNNDTIVLSNEGVMGFTINDTITFDITNDYTINTNLININSETEFNIVTQRTIIDSVDEVIIKSGKIILGENATEPLVLGDKLNGILGEIIDAITKLTVPTGTGPSLTPINTPLFLSIKAKLNTILSTQNKTK